LLQVLLRFSIAFGTAAQLKLIVVLSA